MSSIQVGLVLLFGLSGLACFGTLRGVAKVPSAEVRYGLTGLLILSGLWAFTETARLLVATPVAKDLLYVLGLVVGLPTVGAWLYFCSAYTGHEYHRKPLFRKLAVGGYLLIVAVKITNPYHGLYYESTLVSAPFPHLEISLMPAHWIVTGLAYVLTAIGFYLLYELFTQSNLETRALTGLVIITGLPAILDVLGYTGNLLLTLNYEPVGVAVFAVGVLYAVDEQFVALPAFWRQDVLTALDEPILVFDRNGSLRDYNQAAVDQFPDLPNTVGHPLANAYPILAEHLEDGTELIEIELGDMVQYFIVERQELTIEESRFGEVVILSDVTVLEQQRRELQRQNDQFGDFSEAITHELRNTLAIAQGYFDVVASEIVDDGQSQSVEHYERATKALARMEQITTDLSKLAKYGQTLEELGTCDVTQLAERGWENAETGDMSLAIETSGSIRGDEARLTELFKNAFEFARVNDATRVTISFDGDDIVIQSDGNSLSPTELERAFKYGEAVPSAEYGMLLPNVQTIARSHGWDITSNPEQAAGVSFYIETR